MTKVEPAPNSVVAVGAARFGNALPLALIAGPCALEGRAHALEVASALKEIAARLQLGQSELANGCLTLKFSK